MFREYRDLEKGEFIVVGVDTAVGGNDFCAAQFLSKDKLDVPIVYHSQASAVAMTPLLHQMLEKVYNLTGVQPCVCYERNNGGWSELERLAVLNKNQKYIIYEQKDSDGKSTGKLGWDTNSATRPKMLQDLQECINNKLLVIYDRPTVNEFFSFIVSSSGKPQAENSSHDDLVMSLAIAWQLYQTENKSTPINYTDIVARLPEENLFDEDGLY